MLLRIALQITVIHPGGAKPKPHMEPNPPRARKGPTLKHAWGHTPLKHA